MNDSYKLSAAYLKAKMESIEETVKDTGKKNSQILDKLSRLENRVSRLEVKSGIWGALGGTMVIAIQVLLKRVF